LRENKYHLQDNRLIVWVPHASYINLFSLQLRKLEDCLRAALQREDIQVQAEVKPEVFPEIQAFQTSQERWEELCKRNPLAKELLRLAKGQVLPKEVERYLHAEQDASTQEKS